MVLLSAATVSDKMHSSVRHLRIAGKVGCTIVVVGISRKGCLRISLHLFCYKMALGTARSEQNTGPFSLWDFVQERIRKIGGWLVGRHSCCLCFLNKADTDGYKLDLQ